MKMYICIDHAGQLIYDKNITDHLGQYERGLILFMIKTLEKMNPEKRSQLIDSSFKEFGENGFLNASTNNIVKEAGISKGLLFHYFPTKKILYETLSIYAITLVGDAIEDGLNWQDGDIVKRLEDITIIKLSLYKKYPNMLKFSKTLFEDLSYDLIKEKVYEHIPNYHEKIFQYNINYDLFKKDLDVKKAVIFLQYFLDGFSENLLPLFKDKNKTINLDEIERELKEYLEFYKKEFYK